MAIPPWVIPAAMTLFSQLAGGGGGGGQSGEQGQAGGMMGPQTSMPLPPPQLGQGDSEMQPLIQMLMMEMMRKGNR